MVPAGLVTAWAVTHPWPTSVQVEQDLLLSRAICAIAADPLSGHGTRLSWRHRVTQAARQTGAPVQRRPRLCALHRRRHRAADPCTDRSGHVAEVHRSHEIDSAPKGVLANDISGRHTDPDQDRSQHPREIHPPSLTCFSHIGSIPTGGPVKHTFARSRRPNWSPQRSVLFISGRRDVTCSTCGSRSLN